MPIRGPQSSGTDSVATHQRTKSAGQTQKLQTRTKVVAHTGPTNGSEDYDWNKQGIGQTKVFMACHERTSTRSRYSAELMKCLFLFFFQKLGMKKRIYANVSLSQYKANQWALKVVPIPWMDSAHVISAFAQGVQLHPGVFRHWCDAMLRVNTGQWEYLFSNSVRRVRLECLMISWSWYDVKKVVTNGSWNPEERLWS